MRPEGSDQIGGPSVTPSSILATDPAIKAAPVESRWALLVAQNKVVLESSSCCDGLKVPFFLRPGFSEFHYHSLLIEYQTVNVEELPDVVLYYQELIARETSPDMALLRPAEPTSTKIPTGFLLPGAFIAGNVRMEVVYSVRRWITENTAETDIYTPEPFDSVPGSVLRRFCISEEGQSLSADVGVTVSR